MVGSAFAEFADITWIEVRPGLWGASHRPIDSVSWGGGGLQGLHREAVCEQVGMELCTGPQLREGENRRQMEKEGYSSEYIFWKGYHALRFMHKYLSSNYRLGTGLRESIQGSAFQF